MKKVAVFLDGSNCFYAQRKMGWSIDAEKLLDFCKGFGEVIEATYYTGVAPESNQKKYHDKLAYIGYSLVTKPVKTMYDQATGQTTQKANLDTEIVLDMFNMIDRYDMAILISGDGDFERAVQQLKSRGKEVKVISSKGLVAAELVYAVGINYIDMVSIRESIARTAQTYPIQDASAEQEKAS